MIRGIHSYPALQQSNMKTEAQKANKARPGSSPGVVLCNIMSSRHDAGNQILYIPMVTAANIYERTDLVYQASITRIASDGFDVRVGDDDSENTASVFFMLFQTNLWAYDLANNGSISGYEYGGSETWE